jgi:hypothetical protein
MFNGIINFFKNTAFNGKAFTILILNCILFLVGLIIPGIYLLVIIRNLNFQSTGTIVNAACQSFSGRNDKFLCNLTIKYPANDRYYTGVHIETNSSINYNTGDNVTVFYDTNNPRTFIIQKYRIRTFGVVFICLGIFFIACTFFVYSLSYRKDIPPLELKRMQKY